VYTSRVTSSAGYTHLTGCVCVLARILSGASPSCPTLPAHNKHSILRSFEDLDWEGAGRGAAVVVFYTLIAALFCSLLGADLEG